MRTIHQNFLIDLVFFIFYNYSNFINTATPSPAQAGAVISYTNEINGSYSPSFARTTQPLLRSSPPSCVCGARARSILIFILK
jgi:hypothetical protein